MKTFELGDLAKLSVRGQLSLCGGIGGDSFGVVIGTPNTIPNMPPTCVKVKWMVGMDKISATMHIDYIELVDGSDKKCPPNT